MCKTYVMTFRDFTEILYEIWKNGMTSHSSMKSLNMVKCWFSIRTYKFIVVPVKMAFSFFTLKIDYKVYLWEEIIIYKNKTRVKPNSSSYIITFIIQIQWNKEYGIGTRIEYK